MVQEVVEHAIKVQTSEACVTILHVFNYKHIPACANTVSIAKGYDTRGIKHSYFSRYMRTTWQCKVFFYLPLFVTHTVIQRLKTGQTLLASHVNALRNPFFIFQSRSPSMFEKKGLSYTEQTTFVVQPHSHSRYNIHWVQRWKWSNQLDFNKWLSVYYPAAVKSVNLSTHTPLWGDHGESLSTLHATSWQTPEKVSHGLRQECDVCSVAVDRKGGMADGRGSVGPCRSLVEMWGTDYNLFQCLC